MPNASWAPVRLHVRAARRDPVRYGLPSLFDGPHHATQASKSIDLLGIAQLGRIE